MAVTYTYTKKINTYQNGINPIAGKYTLKLVATFTKLSTNYTRIKMTGYIKSNDSSYYSYNLNAGGKNVLKIINGSGVAQYSKTFYADYDTRNTGNYYKMWTRTVDVKHADNGNRSVRLVWTFNDTALPGWRPKGTLYAPSSTSLVKLTRTTYQVKFNANGGVGAPAAQTKIHGTALTLSSTKPTRAADGATNYKFLGWSLNRDATAPTYFAGGTYKLNAANTLYAVWSTATNKYTVIFDPNYGDLDPTSKEVTKGSSITTPHLVSRKGYVFAGWNTSAAGTGTSYSAGASVTVNSDLILYAKWTPYSHTVHYNTQGGSYTPASFTYTTGDEKYVAQVAQENIEDGSENTETEDGSGAETETGGTEATVTPVTKAGHIFKYWNTAADGSGITFYPGDEYTVLQNGGTVTLYAIWAAEEILLYKTKKCECIEFVEGGVSSFIKGGFVSAPELVEGNSMTLSSNKFIFSELIEK